MMKRVVVANRGAAAARIIRALKLLDIESIAIHSEADRELPYLSEASEAHCVGAAAASASYLNQDAILSVLTNTGADGLHPGYGFLSENADFAQRVEDAGACFIGPSPRWIRALGNKAAARSLMREHGLPMGGSTEILPFDDPARLTRAAKELGYPVLIKPAGGGGGIGMIPVASEEQLFESWQRAHSLAHKAFGNADLYLERFIRSPRHIEFQFLADRHGKVWSLFERDCSTQRRYQKVIEEAPAPAIERALVDRMARQLEEILGRIGYDVIGTVETLYTPETGFSFLEINTRLQVEHAVTESITGVDIVAAQIRLAAGEPLAEVLPEPPGVSGHAIEARIYAEDPVKFIPSPGELRVFAPPSADNGIRVETGYAQGNRVSIHYDPMVAKVIAHAPNRDAAISKLIDAMRAFKIEGIKTNIPFVLNVLQSDRFAQGRMTVDNAGSLFAV